MFDCTSNLRLKNFNLNYFGNTLSESTATPAYDWTPFVASPKATYALD